MTSKTAVSGLHRAVAVAAIAVAGLTALPAAGATLPPVLRAGRQAYLRVEPGTLRLTLLKRDLNIYPAPDNVTFTLRDPLWRVLAEETIPDDGATGPGAAAELQRRDLAVEVPRGGVCTLVVAGQGGDFVWGLETSAGSLVVDGEIALNDAAFAGEVFFPAPPGAIAIKVQAFHVPGARQEITLSDAAGEVLHRVSLDKAGVFHTLEVPADQGRRDGLWSFEVPRMDFKADVPGLTVWAFDRAAFFVPSASQGILLPRRVVRYLPAQSEAPVLLRFHAPEAAAAGPFEFRLEKDPADHPLAARVAAVHPKPYPGTRADAVVELHLALDPARPDPREASVWVSAFTPGAAEPTGTAEIRVRQGVPPAAAPLELPIVNRPHEHENVTLGYVPDMVTNEVAFDLLNRPVIRQRWLDRNWSPGLAMLREGRWEIRDYEAALKGAFPDYTHPISGAGFLGCKVAFDSEGGIYTMVRLGRNPPRPGVALLFSPDDGRTWQVTELPGTAFDIERFSGHNALPHPPPVLTYTATRPHPTARYGGYHDLDLYLPRREGSRLVVGEPIRITDTCLGSCQHSGGPPSLATRDGRTHVVWGAAIEEDRPGVPTWVVTCDHRSRTLGTPVLVGYAPPINDVHNVPAVCQDSTGVIHIVTGAHGANFLYRHSLAPNTLEAGLSEAVPTLTSGCIDEKTDADGDGRQTYCSLVCDDTDTLHIAFRQWRRGVDPYHGGGLYAALSMQSKAPGQPWSPARVMVVPPCSGYSIYYHKLTVDRRGGLYLAYSYLTADAAYQKQFPELYNFPALILSKDRGKTWKLAATADFADAPR
ncbi:MAG: hypothetical protein GX595_13515 [Lentisphaerae bacterium]|nr:hypothetical protein [Lentisphaerota bacterium]